MPLGASGAAAKFYWKEETTDGTAPSGNWEQFPAFSLDISSRPTLQSDTLLSANTRRNAADPYLGVARTEGTARVPIETVHFGKWLNMLLGDAVSSGSSDYTHVFKSGGSTLPSRSIEKAFPDITRYEVAKGVRANSMEVGIEPDGSFSATIGLMCLSEALAGSSGAGTPVVTTFDRFSRITGAIEYGGSALAGVTGGTFRFSNGMQPVPTIGSGTGIGGIDFGECTGGGTVNLRFQNHTQETAARAGTAVSLTYTATISATKEIEFHFARVFLEPTSVVVEGPTGLSRSYNFTAADDSTDAALLKVTYKNQVAAYA